MALRLWRLLPTVALVSVTAYAAPAAVASSTLSVQSGATVEVVVASVGAVNHRGIAFTSARIRCSGTDRVQGRARLTQFSGRTRVRALASRVTTVACDGLWRTASLVFAPAEGRFAPGHASYDAGLVSCTQVACRVAPTPTQTIRLRRTG